MSRGGSRENSGRKSTWKSGCTFEETRLIRVPSRLTPRLMEIAHKLDEDESFDLVSKSIIDLNKDLVSQLEQLQQQLKELEEKLRKDKLFPEQEPEIVGSLTNNFPNSIWGKPDFKSEVEVRDFFQLTRGKMEGWRQRRQFPQIMVVDGKTYRINHVKTEGRSRKKPWSIELQISP